VKAPDPLEITGLCGPVEQHGGTAGRPDAAPEVTPPPSPPWMSPNLIGQTREVWSARYGRMISEREAAEILHNVRRLAEAVLNDGREPKTP